MRFTRSIWIALLVAIAALPLAATAHAQVAVGAGVSPAVAPDPYAAAPAPYSPAVASDQYAYDAYGPPVCQWGYYAYYPYACAPYGYYGPEWFTGGIFIGAGPWYGWGRRGWGYRPAYGVRGEYVAPARGYVSGRSSLPSAGRGIVGGSGRSVPAPSRSFSGGSSGGFRGGFSGSSRSGGSRGSSRRG